MDEWQDDTEGKWAREMSRKLARMYIRWYHGTILDNTEQEKELAITILEYIWEEYHNRDEGREASMNGGIAARVAAKALRGYQLGRGMSIEVEGGKVRKLLSEADRELKKMVVEVKDMDFQKAVMDAMSAIHDTRKVVEQMIGIGMSLEMDEQMGFRSSEGHRRVCAGRWAGVAAMRKDIYEMIQQLEQKHGEEEKFQEEEGGGMDFRKDYKFALRTLEECNDKLRLVAHNI